MNIGVVLSGGMAKGAYQIGALRAIEKLIPNEEISIMSCASIGVLNGYAYATNKLDIAENMWKNVCSEDTRYYISRILRSSLLQQHINRLHNPADVVSKTFYGTLLDIKHRNIVYKNIGTVAETQIVNYLKACVAMPIYNHPVKLESILYFDGAMVDNIPVYPLMKHNLDYIICIYFDDTSYKFENTYLDNRIIKITFPCSSLIKQSLVFNRDSINRMIEDGYMRTMGILNSILYDGYQNLDSIYQAIKSRNLNETGSLRITGDVIVTNINKVTQKLTKKKII